MSVNIQSISSYQEALAVEELQRLVWPGSDTDVVPAHLLKTIENNGGILLGAYAEDQLVGFVLGFIGVDEASPSRVAAGKLKHCSHMLGVHPDFRDQGIGYQLKLAQRRVLQSQGIRLATWTYDPLESRNAYLNIHRLGATCKHYLANAYGAMRDQRNQGQPSDRFEVEWWLTSPRVEIRIQGSRPPLDLANYLAAGTVKVNPAVLGKDDLLRPAKTIAPLEGNLLLVEIPAHYAGIKDKDPSLALDWRHHSREIFQEAFSGGFLITDFLHLAGEQFPRSYYLLSYGEGTLGA